MKTFLKILALSPFAAIVVWSIIDMAMTPDGTITATSFFIAFAVYFLMLGVSMGLSLLVAYILHKIDGLK